LPHIEKLHQALKGRTDIQVVTFNVDDNLGLVAPFLKENGYTFPVLSARFLMDVLVPMLGIPLNWIVDADGIVRQESVGFGGASEKWVEQVTAALEKARPAK
jgi:hypothetical protein